ncbi:tol-pal system-associated acyl-CoA thioesterase [Leptothrix sp. BB-4]
MPAAETASFVWPVRVYWEDTDAGGVVFYANYLKYFERARTEWLRSLGLSQERLRLDTGLLFVVADTAVRYRQPARLDDALEVTVELRERPGRASLLLDQQVRRGDAVLAEGRIRVGCVDATRFAPCRLPDDLLERLLNTPRA